MLQDFKNFLLKGNAIDLAIGFMFGAAFATVVRSFVDNIIMPPIGLILWKVDFSNLYKTEKTNKRVERTRMKSIF